MLLRLQNYDLKIKYKPGKEEIGISRKNSGWSSPMRPCKTIVQGWPEDVNDFPNAPRPYHHYQNELTVEDSLVLKGEALIITPTEKEMLHKIHEGHQGITKCQYRAWHCIHWPGINHDIKCIVESCAISQWHWSQEPQQPLKPTPEPEWP